MKTCAWDLETNGLLDEVSRVHLLCIKDLDTGTVCVFRSNDEEDTILAGTEMLKSYDLLVAHNGIAYDAQVLEKLYGIVLPWYRHRDTMVLAKLVWADLRQLDMDRRKKAAGKTFPPQMMGMHSLEAWGHRLGNFKGDYDGDPAIADDAERKRTKWGRWNQAMEDYNVRDVELTAALYARILSKEPSDASVLLETQVASILVRQEKHGFLFDQALAPKLYAKLVSRKLELEAEVTRVFTPLFLRDGHEFTPKRDSKAHGYVAGAPMTKVKLTEFNPTSRDHCAWWLKLRYGWEPTEFTADGKPKVDDEVIGKLTYAEAAPLKEYFMVSKRIGQLAEGKEAWLRHVGKDGRIHGRVNSNGAITGRMTHSRPNMAQVPAGYSPYGHECRALFTVPRGKKLVGADAAALELRDLAGYMAAYDDGAYIRTVLDGSKAEGTDIHSVNAKAMNLDPQGFPHGDAETGRDIAKTAFYAFLYGCGDEKLGLVITRKKGPAAVTRGKQARADLLRNLPALGKLVEKVKTSAKARGFLWGLDKRRLTVRSQHAALNTLLQSAGAIQMKRAQCLLDDSLQEAGLIPGKHYEFLATVHDEWQLEVDDGLEELVGTEAVGAIRRAGESFGFRCPLDGEWRAGRNWSETHG